MPCGSWPQPAWLRVAAAARTTRRVVVVLATVSSLLVAPVAFADSPDTHVVQPGETLSDIAAGAGVDTAALAALNGIEDANLVVVGQTIKLPASSGPTARTSAPSASSARTYTVAAGDTLWTVAQHLGTTTATLVDANRLDDADHLVVGAQLVVPGGAGVVAGLESPVAAPNAPRAAPKRSLLVPYTVQAGETLGQVARRFGVPADAIAQASGLDDPNRLSVGSVLKVPLPGREHVVQAGETLRDIAAEEKVDLGSLVDFNALDDPQLIRIGQVVMVPAPPSGQTAASTNPPPAAPGSPPAPATAPASAKPAPSSSAPGTGSPQPAPAAKPVAPKPAVAAAAGPPTDGMAGAGLKLLGATYVWGGSSPSGFDCSGFVWYVARQAGKRISRGMLGEYNAGSHPGRDELKPGDLVFFQNTYSAGLSHNGIYIGGGQFVHAADEAAGVTVSSLGAAYWSSHWFGATRLS